MKFLLITIFMFFISCKTQTLLTNAETESKKLNYDKALDYYNKAYNINPKKHRTLSGRGSTYYLLGENENALTDLHNAVKLKNKAWYNYYNLGLVYKELAQYDSSITYFQKTLEVNDKVCYSQINIAEVLFLQDDSIHASQIINDIFKKNQKNPSCLMAAAYVLYTNKISSNGEILLKEIYDSNRKHPVSNYFYARYFLDNNKLESACIYFNKALNLGFISDGINRELLILCTNRIE